jgi:nuclear GTP-binding protein
MISLLGIFFSAPQAAVAAMLQRVAPEQLMQLYALPRFAPGDADAFLSLAARRLGKVKKGGVPDRDAAAVAVLRDWNSGAVAYFTPPPSDDAHLAGMEAATFVKALGAAFDPATMLKADALVLETAVGGGHFALTQVGAGTGGMADGEEDEEEHMGSSGDESDGFEDEEDEMSGSGEDDEEGEEGEDEVPPPPKAIAKAAAAKAVAAKADAKAAPKPNAKAAKASLFDDPLRDLAVGSADARRAHKASAKKAQKDARRGGRGMDDGPGF